MALYVQIIKMKNIVIIIIGLLFAAVFAILSMSTGMWGCGTPCYLSIGLFFISIAFVIYGILKLVKSTKNI